MEIITHQQENGITVVEQGPDMPYSAAALCAVKVNCTHVIMAGGNKDAGTIYDYAHLYDIKGKSWIELPRMSHKRAAHACGLVTGVDVVVAGGYNDGSYMDNVEIFSPKDMSWRTGSVFPIRASSMPTVQLDNTFITLGGYNKKNFYGDIYKFDETSYVWERLPQTLKTPKIVHGAVLLPRGTNLCEYRYGGRS